MEKKKLHTFDHEILFHRDIEPILVAPFRYAELNNLAAQAHRSPQLLLPKQPNDESVPRVPSADDNSEFSKQFRTNIFEHLRSPDLPSKQAYQQFMPALSGDEGDIEPRKPKTWLSLPPRMYERMQRWANGDFTTEKVVPLPSDKITSDGLTLSNGVQEEHFILESK